MTFDDHVCRKLAGLTDEQRNRVLDAVLNSDGHWNGDLDATIAWAKQ